MDPDCNPVTTCVVGTVVRNVDVRNRYLSFSGSQRTNYRPDAKKDDEDINQCAKPDAHLPTVGLSENVCNGSMSDAGLGGKLTLARRP